MENTMSQKIGGCQQAGAVHLYHMLVEDATGTRRTFAASSWNEAMDVAAFYMGRFGWKTAEYGTLRIPYTVYRLPANSLAPKSAGDNDGPDAKTLQTLCKSRGAVHVQEPSEPCCTEPAGHDFTATRGIEGGDPGNPGVFAHGESEIAASHCQHCGQTRTVDSWDEIAERIVPGGNTRYGGKLEPWPPSSKGGDF